ncbi:MAG: MBL fold metallo-hydrolase [Candidatus Lokiarchaeota archaeon]|nr:MBL fold metallo-hydrolase [Candidatus Lokiarchaeota archaeon]
MKEVFENIYHIGSSGCDIYLIDTKTKDGLVLIDCGMNIEVIKNISKKDLDPLKIKHCIITHCHIDHIAACYELKIFNPSIRFYAHELDAKAIEEKGHDEKTAASWYGITYNPIKLNKRFKEDIELLRLGIYNFNCIHTPGHTPGSISIFLEIKHNKILFAQDVHGPFSSSFGSNLKDYQNSMEKLLNFKADILCEGHYGIIQPADEVERFIKSNMNRNIE